MQVCGAQTEKGETCRIKKSGAPIGWRCRFHNKQADSFGYSLTALVEIGLKGPQPTYDEPVIAKGPIEAGIKERSLALEKLRAELKPMLVEARALLLKPHNQDCLVLDKKIRAVHKAMFAAKIEMRAFQMRKKREAKV